MKTRNSTQLFFTSFKTDLGWVAVAASARGLKELILPQPSAEGALAQLSLHQARANKDAERFDSLIKRLQVYFQGKPIAFPDILYLATGTPFQQRVWRTARSISYGQTQSYGWIARQMNQPLAFRAVGQALGKNPLPIIIPCHRVLASGGGLGGFSGGLETKKSLLRLEGISIT